MYRYVVSIITVILSGFIFHTHTYAVSPVEEKQLVQIDEETYTVGDFNNWWSRWKEEGMNFPESPDSYIDWVLMYRQAERMELFADPSYQKKVMTFLKARSLMMLKSHEIDSKIEISSDEMQEYYKEKYIPIWRINLISFPSKEEAEQAYAKLLNGTLTVEMLASPGEDKKEIVDVKSLTQRPGNTHKEWVEIIRSIEPGGFSEPIPFKNSDVIIHLLDSSEGNNDDFEQFAAGIRRTLWKQKEQQLTAALINTLMEKYNVTINEERLKSFDPNIPAAELSDEPLVTFDRGIVTEKDFANILNKERNYRTDAGFDDSGYDYKVQVLNGILSQTLTSLEGLDRHYEQKPPFDKTYQFYVRNRLVSTLSQKVIEPDATVSEDEKKTYYNDNIENLTRPASYKFAIYEGTKKEVNGVMVKTLSGQDFINAVSQVQQDHSSMMKNMSEDQMDPELVKMLTRLKKNEVSPVFNYQGKYAIVKLIDTTPGSTVSFDDVSMLIETKLLKEKREKIRREYLLKLREKTTIVVDDEAWQSIKTEHMQKDADK